ncbi:MAG: ABC transporter substrate-binding protein [Thermoleophilia bacterium]|nr:ABC transporter substrate-binding protein [Thermoleophilia bacterium]MDH5332905.1 ABC transporter substrate-binding protein [Thermoleophilia bacterium]
MKGRMWFSVAMVAIGTSLLAAALVAGPAAGGTQASAVKAGGSITQTSRSDFDYVDTALAYFSHSWEMMAATNITLLYYPHTEGPAGMRLTPLGAKGMPKVSKDGKTYTFTLERGFKFSDGTNVTSANYKRAFDRALNKDMQSPASSFLDDLASYRAPNPTTFIVVLKKNAPDFLARMSMNFFAPVPVNTPINPDGITKPLSTGPYVLREWNQKTSALAVRNPFWKNNQAPFNKAGFKNYVNEYRWVVGADPATQQLQCEKGEADICGFPPANARDLSEKYGINKSRFFVKRQTVLWYLAMNTSQPLFQNNVSLRQAVANAIDRRFMVAQHGYLAGKRTDQFLPYAMPGFKEANIYSLKGPNYNRAKQLAQGNTRTGKAVMYTFNVAQGPPIAQSVQFNLKQIGIDVEIKLLDRVVQHEKSATRGEPFDLTLEGWGMDYPDPSNFINVLLDGRRIQADNNVNVSYFNDPKYNAAMDRANSLAGQARLTAYGNLDIDLMKNAAPVAPYISTNYRVLLSTKVGCYGYTSINGDLLTQMCVK